MKRLFTGMVLFLAVFCLSSMAMHKFYVAVFQFDHVPKKKEFQVTSRIFVDDLSNALDKKYGRKLYLATSKEVPDATALVKKYLLDNMQVKVNGKVKPVNFLGRETEDDILICYFTVPAENKIKSLEVKNTTLFEAFSDQQNIIHTKINNNKKSLMLTNDKQSGILEY